MCLLMWLNSNMRYMRGLNYLFLCCQLLLSSVSERNEMTIHSYKEHRHWRPIYVTKRGMKAWLQNWILQYGPYSFWTVFGWTVILASIEALNPQYLFYGTCTSLYANTQISCNKLEAAIHSCLGGKNILPWASLKEQSMIYMTKCLIIHLVTSAQKTGVIWEHNTFNSYYVALESERQNTLQVKPMENSSLEEKSSVKICYFHFSSIHETPYNTKAIFHQLKSKYYDNFIYLFF